MILINHMNLDKGNRADYCSQIRTRRLMWDAAGKDPTLPSVVQYMPCSTKDLCSRMRDDKSWRPTKWVSDARQRASAWLSEAKDLEEKRREPENKLLRPRSG